MALIGEISWYRGDSFPITLTIKAKNVEVDPEIDITDYVFLFTVNTEQNPQDDTNEVFQVNGVVDPDQVTNKGKVTITPSATDTNIPDATYYYDIQMENPSGHIRTIAKNKFIIGQDITKD